MQSSDGASCPICGAVSVNDNANFVHLNMWHCREFVQLLRERRLQEYFPRADPTIFRVLYDDSGTYPSITPALVRPRSVYSTSNSGNDILEAYENGGGRQVKVEEDSNRSAGSTPW